MEYKMDLRPARLAMYSLLALPFLACSASGQRRSSPPAETASAQLQPSPARSAQLSEEVSEEQMMRLRSARDKDCNGNGIADAIDIARGFALDTNHNGTIDECDTDSTVAHNAEIGFFWWRHADQDTGAYLSVVHGFTPRITIRYTVPKPGADVALTVQDSTGTTVVGLVRQFQANGPYIIQWDRSVRGKPLAPGTYKFRLLEANERVERTMGWANW